MKSILVRQWGSGVTHRAELPDSFPLHDAVILGAVCQVIFEPVVTICRVKLRGKPSGKAGDTVIVMQPGQLTCRTCGALGNELTRQQQGAALAEVLKEHAKEVRVGRSTARGQRR